MSRRRKLLLSATLTVALLGVVAVGGVYALLRQRAVSYAAPAPSTPLHDGDLQAFRGKRVYFGHQSVGKNILDGLNSLYRSSGGSLPSIQEVKSASEVKAGGGGLLIHSRVGNNGQPDTKLAAFDSMMRTGMADRVDVAMMKLCYVDFSRDTDPREVFDHYRTTMANLERDYPGVKFVYTTVPLTTTDGFRNNVRTQFNSLVRSELKDKTIFDIAEVESRGPDGSRATGSTYGFPFEQLQSEYASDGAHLNNEGAQRVAGSFVATVNSVTR